MSIQFILGRAGTGKSQEILDQITTQILKEPAQKIILLVPEQATFNFEYELAANPYLNGLLSVQVLSFQRLAWMVMQETGGAAKVLINDLGKLMILRRHILASTSELTLLNGAADKPGYINSIAATISEFKRNQLSVEQLTAILNLEALPQSLLSQKLIELNHVYNCYCQHMAPNSLDADDTLKLLAEKIPLSKTLAETIFFIDEFNSFTPQELEIIQQLLAKIPKMLVALTVPAAEQELSVNDQKVFFSTNKTFFQLRQIAKAVGITQLPSVILSENQRAKNAPELAYLERGYFTAQAAAFAPGNAASTTLQLIQAQNQQSEVDKVAREIRRLCREQHYHYSDIGIFARDFGSYDLLLETAFQDYDIPFFLDSKRTVIQHPLLELIMAALDIVNANWTYQSVFRYLKTDLTPLARPAVDELENYVLAHGLRGSQWTNSQPWTYRIHDALDDLPDEDEDFLADINCIRAEVVAPLQVFNKSLAIAKDSTGLVSAVFELLKNLAVPMTLEHWTTEAAERGDLELAQMHNQIWNNVMDIFDQLTEITKDDVLSLVDFMTIMETGFNNMDLGMIPSGLDQVFIGSLQRSRNHQLKVVFILGVNEGVFPAKPTTEGLFNDFEKEILQRYGIHLSATTKERLYDEEFLIYTALTRAGEHLYLSYAVGDGQGKGLKPSGIIHRIHELFPDLTEIYTEWPPKATTSDLLDYISHPAKALSLLGAQLNHSTSTVTDEIWREIYNWLLSSPLQHPLQSCLRSLFHQNQPEMLSPTQVKKLYQEPLRLSVSSIEKYRQCPYSHFLTYGLHLEERPIYKLESLDIGLFYHKAMENFHSYLEDEHLKWGQLDRAQISQITLQIVDELAPQLQNEILLSSGRYQYIKGKLTKTLERSALLLAEHGRSGFFEATGVEMLFGPEGNLPGIRIRLSDGTQLELIGKIDRIEQACTEDVCYLRIIDFKTGTKGLSLLEIFYGLKIQLLSYLEVALNFYQQKNRADYTVLPAGALYYFFKDPLISADLPLDDSVIETQIMAEMTPKGLLTMDLRALKLADNQLDVGKSRLLPFTLKKNAEVYLREEKPLSDLEDPGEIFDSRSLAMVTADQLDLLRQHVLTMIKSTGEAILDGNIAVMPCKMKHFEGCQYCGYQAICQFDCSLPNNAFHLMADIEPAAIWTLLNEEVKTIV